MHTHTGLVIALEKGDQTNSSWTDLLKPCMTSLPNWYSLHWQASASNQSKMWRFCFQVKWRSLWQKVVMNMKLFIRRVRNWRRACDQRGLTQLQRCRFNYQMNGCPSIRNSTTFRHLRFVCVCVCVLMFVCIRVSGMQFQAHWSNSVCMWVHAYGYLTLFILQTCGWCTWFHPWNHSTHYKQKVENGKGDSMSA